HPIHTQSLPPRPTRGRGGPGKSENGEPRAARRESAKEPPAYRAFSIAALLPRHPLLRLTLLTLPSPLLTNCTVTGTLIESCDNGRCYEEGYTCDVETNICITTGNPCTDPNRPSPCVPTAQDCREGCRLCENN